MPLILNGSTGISGTDGSAGTPAVQGTDGNTGMFFPAADQIAFAEGGVEAMRLDASGNLGLGTTTPGTGIANRVFAINGTDTGIHFLTSGADTNRIYSSSGEFRLQTATAIPLVFYTDNTERARITSGGNLLVGTTSNTTNSRLLVNTSSAQNVICADSNSAGVTHVLVTTTLSSAGGSDAFGAYDASGIAARITSNGFYQSRPNSYGSTSDIKLKENVVDASPKLADLMRVRVRNYNYKDDPNLKQLGVIAQELEPVFPGLVYETQDRDADGTDLGTTTKNVKYSVFVPMLIKALQEQQVQIEELKARVAALEAR